ncbi:MAG: hypothetical protein V3U75_06585 [Methylococcaceae bacterium]
MTEPRYLVVICAVWFAILIACQLIQRTNFQLRQVLVSLAILALIISVGPWRIDTLPVKHQLIRLQALLTKQNMLVNQQYYPPKTQLDFAMRKSISSMVTYIITHGAGDSMSPWFSDKDNVDSIISRCMTRRCYQSDGVKFVKLMGIDFVRSHEKKQNESFRISLGGDDHRYRHDNTLVPLAGFDYAIPLQLYFNQNLVSTAVDQVWPESSKNKITVLLRKDNELEISFGKARKESINLNKLLNKLASSRDVKVPAEEAYKLIHNRSNNGLKIRLYIENINGRNNDGTMQITNVQGMLLIQFLEESIVNE